MPPKQKPSHSSASRRGMSASASSARRLHPGSGHHHHTPAAPKRPPTGAPDHPHYYSAGRTGGGQGSSLRHDSSRARAPDHVLSATHHPGSQALAEHLHQSLRQNRAALEQPSQGEDMHRALFEQSSRPQPERKTAASGYVEPIFRIDDGNDVSGFANATESYHNRLRREVEHDYYSDSSQMGGSNGLKFADSQGVNFGQREQNAHQKAMSSAAIPNLDDFDYVRKSYQEKINDDNYQSEGFAPRGGFFTGKGSNNTNHDDINFDSFKFRSPDDFADHRATSQTYRRPGDENVVDWQMIDHARPDWKKTPEGDRSKIDAKEFADYEEKVNKINAHYYALAKTPDPRITMPYKSGPAPGTERSMRAFWRNYMKQDELRKRSNVYNPNIGTLRHKLGIDANERVKFAQLLRRSRPKHPYHEHAKPVEFPYGKAMETHEDIEDWYVKYHNHEKALAKGATRFGGEAYKDKIRALRGNVSALSNLQGQVNSLRAQFYRSEAVRKQQEKTPPKSQNKGILRDDARDPMDLRIARQIELDTITERRAKNVQWVIDNADEASSITRIVNEVHAVGNDTDNDKSNHKKMKVIRDENGNEVEVINDEGEEGKEDEEGKEGEEGKERKEGKEVEAGTKENVEPSRKLKNIQVEDKAVNKKIYRNRKFTNKVTLRPTNTTAPTKKYIQRMMKKRPKHNPQNDVVVPSSSRKTVLRSQIDRLGDNIHPELHEEHAQLQKLVTDLIANPRRDNNGETEVSPSEILRLEALEHKVQQALQHVQQQIDQLEKLHNKATNKPDTTFEDQERDEYIAQKQLQKQKQKQKQQQQQQLQQQLQVEENPDELPVEQLAQQEQADEAQIIPLVFIPVQKLRPPRVPTRLIHPEIQRPIHPLEMPGQSIKRETIQQQQQQQQQQHRHEQLVNIATLTTTGTATTTVKPSTPSLHTPVLGAAFKQLEEMQNADREDPFATFQLDSKPTHHLDSDDYIKPNVLRSVKKQSQGQYTPSNRSILRGNNINGDESAPMISPQKNLLLDRKQRSALMPQIVKPAGDVSSSFAVPPNVVYQTNGSLNGTLPDGVQFIPAKSSPEEREAAISPYVSTPKFSALNSPSISPLSTTVTTIDGMDSDISITVAKSTPSTPGKKPYRPIIEIRPVTMMLGDVDHINRDTDSIENRHQIFDKNAYAIPGIDASLVNSVRFTHKPNQPNQISAVNQLVEKAADTML